MPLSLALQQQAILVESHDGVHLQALLGRFQDVERGQNGAAKALFQIVSLRQFEDLPKRKVNVIHAKAPDHNRGVRNIA